METTVAFWIQGSGFKGNTMESQMEKNLEHGIHLGL